MTLDDEKTIEFYEIFKGRRSAISLDEVHIIGRTQDLDDDEMGTMIEELLDNGMIHEPVIGYLAATR